MGIGALRAALMVMAVLASCWALPASSREPQRHGDRLLAQYHLPAEAIARYAAMAAGSAGNEERRASSLFADALPWIGPTHAAGVGRNPYTLVITVQGLAKTAGDVHSQWQAGWEVYESPAAMRELLQPVSGLAAKAVAAGAPLTLTARTGPISFRGERRVAPVLGLVYANNLEINDVRLEVWSGTAPLTLPAAPLSRTALLAIGAACLLAWAALKLNLFGPRAAPLPRLERMTRPVPEPALEAPAQPVAAMPFRPPHRMRVTQALLDVLSNGLSVRTELDTARGPARRH